MSRHDHYDSPAHSHPMVDDRTPDGEILGATGRSNKSNELNGENDLWRAFAASAGNAALRVVLTIAFALFVIVVMGQVSGAPAEAAEVAAESAVPVAAPAKADKAAESAALPIIPIALSQLPSQSADLASLRRGAAMFATYCLACHAAGRVHFGQLRELGFSDADIAANLNPSGAPLTDPMHAAMPAAAAEEAFGHVPPDLSLAVREKGADWLYTYLRSFYMDPTARMGANNLLVPDVGMPNVLAGLQGARNAVFASAAQNASDTAQQTRKFVRFERLAPGSMSDAAYDQAIAELVAYMAWMADPHSAERRHLGPWVMGFLVLFCFCAWGLMRAYWRGTR